MTICTWNSQGYKFEDNIIKQLIVKNNIDILCLQECGILSNITFNVHRNIKVGQWPCDKDAKYNVLYYEWGSHQKASRCNMAILVRDTITIHDAICLETDTGEQTTERQEPTETDSGGDSLRSGLRGMLHTKIEADGRFYRIANVHLPSGKPGFARKIGHTFLGMYFMRTENVIMVGDFNTLPDSWNFNGSIHKLVVANNGYTYPSSGKTFDYMVTTMSPSSIIANVVPAPGSDHLPVVFSVP